MHRFSVHFSVHFRESTEIWTNTEILCRVDTLSWREGSSREGSWREGSWREGAAERGAGGRGAEVVRQRDIWHLSVVAIREVRDNFHPVSLSVEQVGVVDGQLQGLAGVELYSIIFLLRKNCIPSSIIIVCHLH